MSNPIRTTMVATVIRVEPGKLFVCDCETHQEVIVHTNLACCFFPGECVCIHFSGAMTLSLPPQITASCIPRYETSH